MKTRLAAAFEDARLESPERALWSAVIEQALMDQNSINEKVKDAARRWLRSNQTHPGSFAWCADMLGLNCGAVRKALSEKHSKRIYSIGRVHTGEPRASL